MFIPEYELVVTFCNECVDLMEIRLFGLFLGLCITPKNPYCMFQKAFSNEMK